MEGTATIGGNMCYASNPPQPNIFQNNYSSPTPYLRQAQVINPVFRPFVIARSYRRPGVGNGAINDITYGDMAQGQIQEISTLFAVELSGSSDASGLFANVRLMAGLLFTPVFGEMRSVVFDMIDFFQANGGTAIQNYRNGALNRHVQRHRSTEEFVRYIREEFKRRLQINRDPSVLRDRNLQLDFSRRPIFHDGSVWNPLNPGDIQGGLTFAINDTWAYDITLRHFVDRGSTYTATIEVTLYDHFGLDINDVTITSSRHYAILCGFRSWFVLQHWNRMAYKPFITTMEFEETFTDRF